ncbi:MAG: sulfite exporter TauE/SafE family protein [Acidobacteriota bacterium]
MTTPEFLAVLPVVFLAFVLKGLTGFGPGLLIVPVAAVLIGAQEAVLLIAFLDLVSNTLIACKDRTSISPGFWIPIAIAMGAGSLIGGLFLKLVPPRDFSFLLAVVVALTGVWFLFGRISRQGKTLMAELPAKTRPKDTVVALSTGIFGGFFGLTGILIATYLGGFLTKEVLRRVLVRVLLVSATIRVITYTATGMYSLNILLLAAGAIPLVLTGLYCGDRLLFRISELWFSRVIGAAMLISAARMLL